MALDGIVIANLTRDLKARLEGAKISKIAQPEKDELLFTIKNYRDTYRVLMSASASLPLIYFTESNKPGPMTAPNFCMLLRKHIGSGRILSVTQPGMERVIEFLIEHLDEMGDVCRKRLIIELMGKHSNIIFCREDGMILDSIKHVSAQVSSVREVLPGRQYFIPKTVEKANPLEVTEENFAGRILASPMSVQKAVYTNLTGLSPIISTELCHLASIDGDRSANQLSGAEITHLYHMLSLMMEDVREGRFTPNIIYRRGEPVEFASVPLTCFHAHVQNEARPEAASEGGAASAGPEISGRDAGGGNGGDFRRSAQKAEPGPGSDSGYEARVFDSVSRLLETYYASRDAVTRIRQKSSDLRRIVQTALERNYKKLDLQEKQLRDTEKRDKYRVYGELLNTYGYELAGGEKELKCLNYYTGEEIRIPLDPQLTARENSQKYFDRYNKLKRTYEALTELTENVRREIDHLESIATSLEIALKEEDLVQIKEELTEYGYIRRHTGGKKVRVTSRPFHYLSSDGFHIYVGKNNYQNEELTFKLASGNDWWFHAKGIPGSHVIVKTDGKELPNRVFEEAGALAAYYSKGRSCEKVEIDYIQKKHIRKVAGAAPGFVIYHTNYSLVAEPSADLKEIV